MILPHYNTASVCRAPHARRFVHALTFSAIIALGLALGGCLPGKEEEKKVIARVGEASDTVQAQKLAADMAMAAERHLSTLNATTPAVTDEATLKSVNCDGNKVVAYVPRTSPLTKDGAIPLAMADRMRSQLGSKYTADRILTAGDPALSGCLPDPTLVAENSPVLVLENTVAALAEVNQHDYTIQSVSMAPCSGGQPGVIITKTVIDASGTPTTLPPEEHCGAAAPASSALPSISFTTGEMADWQSRLTSTGSGPVLATRNYTCIAGTSTCTPIEVNAGTEIECDLTTETTEYISNPEYHAASQQFVPTAGVKDCGRGWEGELAARVKHKRCRIKRNGVLTSEIPRSIYDIAYVGAQCRKNEVTTIGSCPAGHNLSFESTGRMVQKEDLFMNQMLALTPRKTGRTNSSSIAYRNTTFLGTSWSLDTNMTPDDEVLVTGGIPNLKYAGGLMLLNRSLFNARSNLSAVAASGFDQAYVTEMKSLNKVGMTGTPTCYAMSQDCHIDEHPAAVELVNDQSFQMNIAVPEEEYVHQTYTSCRATMVNMFEADRREAACKAAQNWHNLATTHNVLSEVQSRWVYSGLTSGFLGVHRMSAREQGNYWLNTLKGEIPSHVTHMLNQYENTMKDALGIFADTRMPHLRYALAVGQTCSPPVVGEYLKVQDDMYGYCIPELVKGFMPDSSGRGGSLTSCSPGSMTCSSLSDLGTGEILGSCQTGCPGSCITRIRTDASGTPLPPATTHAQIADAAIKFGIFQRVPLKAQVQYSEILNEDLRTPVRLKEQNPSMEDAIAKRDRIIPNMQVTVDTQRITRPATSGVKVHTYQSIDDAIDRLRAIGIDHHRNMRASIILFGSGFDTNCERETTWWEGAIMGAFLGGPFGALIGAIVDERISPDCATMYQSKYFLRNICEPEKPVTGYQCTYCSKRVRNPLNGKYHCMPVPFTPLTGTKTFTVSDIGSTLGTGRPPPGASEETMGPLTPPIKFNTPDTRQRWCTDNEWESGLFDAVHWKAKSVDPIYASSGEYENHHSLVGFLGRHYPNVKVYYMDFSGDPDGLGSFCQKDRNTYDKTKPNSFYKGKQIWYGFDVKNGGITQLFDAIEQSTGGGIPTEEAGKKVCEARYGSNVNIDYGEPPIPFKSQLASYDASVTGECVTPLVYRPPTISIGPVIGIGSGSVSTGIAVEAGIGAVESGTVTLTPGIGVVTPGTSSSTWREPEKAFIPAPSVSGVARDGCNHGFKPWTLAPC